MKRTSPRKTANLSASVHQQLTMYALAASTAGVGALGLGQAAEAKVVYTPANVRIVQNAGLVRIDLNHDGIADFALRNRRKYGTSSEYYAVLNVVPERQANEIWEATPSIDCAAALPKGTKVGPKGRFQPDYPAGKIMAITNIHGTSSCAWNNVKQAYLGLKFVIQGKTHFGWARVKVSVDGLRLSITATLTGYAYETIPGKAIIAGATSGPDEAEPAASLNVPTPEPATLGALAMGAPGLSIWRREESADALV